MKLQGIYKNDQYIRATGTYDGIPYQIENYKDSFVLNRKFIRDGVGIMLSPVAIIDNSWTGVYSETTGVNS
jgi:hypothetical protein